MDGTVIPVYKPVAQYESIFLPDGTHSGVRFDRNRGILEIQKKGVKYFFDLALMQQVSRQN